MSPGWVRWHTEYPSHAVLATAQAMQGRLCSKPRTVEASMKQIKVVEISHDGVTWSAISRHAPNDPVHPAHPSSHFMRTRVIPDPGEPQMSWVDERARQCVDEVRKHGIESGPDYADVREALVDCVKEAIRLLSEKPMEPRAFAASEIENLLKP